MPKMSLNDVLDNLDDNELKLLETGGFDSLSNETAQVFADNLDEEGMSQLEGYINSVNSTRKPPLESGLTQKMVNEVQASGSISGDVPPEFAQGAAFSKIGESVFGDEPLSNISGGDLSLAGQAIAREGIETGASVAGFGLGTISPIKFSPTVFSGAAELGARKVTRALGLRGEAPFISDLAEVAAGEALGIGFENFSRLLTPYLPKKVSEAIKTGEGRLYDDPESRILDVMIGDKRIKSSELVRKLDKEDQVLVPSQLTGGQLGREESELLAEKSAQSEFTRGTSFFKKLNEKALKKRGNEILQGIKPVEFDNTNFSNAFNNIINDRVLQINGLIKKDGQQMSRAVLRSGDKEVIDISSFEGGFEELVNIFKNGKIAFSKDGVDQLPILGIDRKDLNGAFTEILNSIRKTRINDKGKKESFIPESISLKDYDALTSRIDKLKGKFADSLVTQRQLSGVISRFEKEVLDPIVSASAKNDFNASMVLATRQKIRLDMEERSRLLDTKTVGFAGKNELSQQRKSKGGSKIIKNALSDAESFKQIEKTLVEIGDTNLLPAIRNNFVVDLWTNKSVKNVRDSRLGSGVELNGEKLGKYLAQPENRELVKAVKGEKYLENLDQVSEWLRIRDSDPVLIGSLPLDATSGGEAIATTLGKKIVAKLGRHSLRDKSLSVVLLNNIAKRLFGRKYSETELISKLTDPKFLEKFDTALNTGITDVFAFDRFNAILREIGEPITRQSWEAFVDMAQSGKLDVIEEDLIDEEGEQ